MRIHARRRVWMRNGELHSTLGLELGTCGRNEGQRDATGHNHRFAVGAASESPVALAFLPANRCTFCVNLHANRYRCIRTSSRNLVALGISQVYGSVQPIFYETSTAHAALLRVLLCADSFHRREGNEKTNKENQKGRETVCRANPNFYKKWLETGARTGDQHKRSPQVCRSINYTSGLDPCTFLYFSTISSRFLYFFYT